MTGEDFEANTLFCQIVHRIHQMTEVAAKSIEFPDHQRIAPAKGFERGIKAGASIQSSRGTVFIDLRRINAGSDQSVALKVNGLRAIRF